MASASQRNMYTITLTQEQKDRIISVFHEENWDLDLVLVNEDAEMVCDDAECESVPEGPPVPQAMEGEECPHCLCTPCVTDHQVYLQLWWPDHRPPHNRNSKARKVTYKKFWGLMSNLGLWNDPRYVQRKQLALARDPRCNVYAWVRQVRKREIMPNCVLKFVRERLPSPNNQYMDHMWE